MTRREAKLIADELHKLSDNTDYNDQYFTRSEAAQFLRVSVSHMSHNVERYPSRIINGKRLYSKNSLIRFLSS